MRHSLARRVIALVVAVVAALCVAEATPSAQRTPAVGSVTVFAAASLTDVFRQIDPQPTYNFGGSNQLAFQIRQGAPADVFVSAAPSFTQDLFRENLVERPSTFVTNKLVLAVPRSNPAGIRTVFDLARKPVKLVVGTPQVPVGAYTRTVLRNLGLTVVLDKVVSQEPDVRSVVGKVALGEADAGFVYQTDIASVSDRVTAIRLPAFAQPKVRYEIGIVRSTRNRAGAQQFISQLRTPRAKAILRRAGFGLK